LGVKWNMESGYSWPGRLCCWPCWLVFKRCMDERDGWRTYCSQSGSTGAVSVHLDLCLDFCALNFSDIRKRLFGDDQ
jgi:hypothetical protein